MSIEAELKARIRNPDHVRDQLRSRADEQVNIYRDVYYDHPDRSLTAEDRELRVRVIEADSDTRSVLTYKAPVVDSASGSKPEYETEITDAATMRAILRQLGYVELISFTKYCRNYRFTSEGRNILATLVTVPEIDGTFLEVETITDQDKLTEALATVRRVLADLGVTEGDLTTELYTDAVRTSRASDPL